MTNKEEEKMVEELIIKSLIEFCELKSEHCLYSENGNKLIFPNYQDGNGNNTKVRISEQEAKILFIKLFETDMDVKFHYSVETPTKSKYSFTGKNHRSGRFDMCIHDKDGHRECLIEFKALNKNTDNDEDNVENNDENKKQKSYADDFVKLLFDDDKKILTNYFIHILDKPNDNIENVYKKKLKEAEKKRNKVIKDFDTRKNGIQSNLKIFLCIMEKKKIIKYDVFFDENSVSIKEIIVMVNLTQELRLEQALADVKEDLEKVTQLIVKGMLTDEDFKYIGKNMGKTLQKLDMSDAMVTEIGKYAFSDCIGLTTVYIPRSVLIIGENAFKDCSAFFVINPDNPNYASENGELKIKT